VTALNGFYEIYLLAISLKNKMAAMYTEHMTAIEAKIAQR